MNNVLRAMVFVLLLIPGFLFAAENNATAFVDGKDYQTLDAKVATPDKPGSVSVVEFFSYGCPACYHFEPTLQAWLKTKPQNIEFSRVPVVFEPKWESFAKAYYTANALDVLDKVTPAMFKAIHQDHLDISDPKNLQKLFVNNGVSAADFDSAFNFSPAVDAQLVNGSSLMQRYKIMMIPTIVIGGKYMVNPRMAGGSAQRMIETINYLVTKASKSED